MKRVLKTVPALGLLAALALALPLAHAAEGGATAEDATKMVKKGMAFIKASGAEKGYAEVSNKAGQFKYQDPYLVVYGLDGSVVCGGIYK